MKISDVAIDRPVFTTMVALAVVVMGGLALTRLGVDLFPDISFPIITITTPYPGAGPEEVESLLTRPIEESVASINGVDEVRSYSRDSVSVVIVTFKLEADLRQASSDVRDRVAMIRGNLPRDIRDPVISRLDPSAQPVLTYAVASPRSSLETRDFVDDVVRPALERVEGVGSVTISGGAEREIQVLLDRNALEGVKLSVAQVAQAISGESFDMPGGRIVTGGRELNLKAVGRFQSPEEVGEVVLTARGDGSQVRVRDVAKVVDGVKEARTITRVNGVESVTFDVQKQGGTNTVAIVDAVEKSVARLRTQLPADIQVTKVIDGSTFIRNNQNHLRQELILGGLLAVLVIFAFMLDWRSTLISAIALPTSVIASFFVMWQLGYTLNIMTMMALSLAIGMLIDDSVVVRENIFRHLELGEDPMTAARKGTGEIALAVMATTFTIVAVFMPVAFTGGLVGRMFRQFGITITVAVLASLVVSFTLDPMLSARITQKVEPDHHKKMREHRYYGPILRAYDGLDAWYRSVLDWTLRHRGVVILGAILLFAGSLMLAPLMGTEFFGRGDQGDFTVNIEVAAGTPLKDTDRLTKKVESLLRAVPEVVTVATTVGPGEEVNKATIRVKATPKTARQRSLSQIMEELRPKLALIPGVTANMREAGMGGSAESTVMAAPIVLNIRGSDYAELSRIAQDAFVIAKSTAGVRDAALNYKPGAPEQRLEVDRTRSADLGVPYSAIASTLRTAVEGNPVAKFRDGEDESDIRVQLRPADRDTLAEILALSVPSTRGATAYLRDVTHLEEGATPSTIERLNRERQITITANVTGRSLGEVIADLETRLETIRKPSGYGFKFAGEAERMKETASNMGLAMTLAIVFIYLVLASQFESFLHPFTIMLALPLAIVGALGGLFLTRFPLGMPAMIGIILLMGLVTKNSILLVDYANQLRDKGMGIIEALLEAGPTRLRPILMTSAAIILGMVPTAVATGEGSEFRAPMSIAVIGGVITSTILTLVVVPVVYIWVDRFTLRGRRERREHPPGSGEGASSPRAHPEVATAASVPVTAKASTAE